MTAQMPERLIFEGQVTSMACCPDLPERHPRIIEIGSAAIESTGCYRGYEGTWEIKDGRFYLVALRGLFQLRGEQPLLADWFSGTLRIPKGEVLQYVRLGFHPGMCEEEVHVKIERGKVMASRVIDNRGRKFDEWWESLRGDDWG